MSSFYERPILNSPYRAPELHHPFDQYGQPLEGEPKQGRRASRFIVPVPASRKKASAQQATLDLETYTENALINQIRGYVGPWRDLRNPADWGVTGVSQRLLEHWRRPAEEWAGPRPFFCQIEAVETIIWLTEVAPRRAATRGLLDQIAKANEEANPELFRLAAARTRSRSATGPRSRSAARPTASCGRVPGGGVSGRKQAASGARPIAL